jgi:hypothetical protein
LQRDGTPVVPLREVEAFNGGKNAWHVIAHEGIIRAFRQQVADREFARFRSWVRCACGQGPNERIATG